MSGNTLRLRREIEVQYHFPFNLSFSTAQIAAHEQGALFEKIAATLNQSYPDYAWASVAYPPLPGTIIEGGAYLRGTPRSARSASHVTVEQELRAAGGVLIGDVKEEVIYVAHGIGSVALSFRVQLDSLEELALVNTKTLRSINALRGRPDTLALKRDFKRFQEAMEQAFIKADSLYDMWGILMRGQPRRGFVNGMNQSFIWHTSDSGQSAERSLEVAPDQLPELLAPLTGASVEETQNLLPHSAGIEFCAQGWDGNVAVLSDPAKQPWLRFFVMYATCSWAVLSDLDAFLYQQMREMARPLTVLPKEARRIMAAIRRIQNSMALLAHEAVPKNIWDSQEQMAVHQGFYDSWGTESLIEGIERKVEYLTGLYENLNNLLQEASQARLSWIMTAFTFLTFAGVLADCISSIDYEGRNLTSPLRIFIIFLGTLSVIAVSAGVGYVMHSRRSLAP